MTIFNPQHRYNALPNLPPKEDLETKKILKKCIEARSSLAELNTSGQLLPNQSILINTLPLLEAKDSSEIENIVTTTDRLFQFSNATDNLADPATKEALRYRTALYEGFKSLGERPLCAATAVQVCSVIKNIEMEVRRLPGTALKNDATGEVIYTPPDGENLLRNLLSNWETFLHENAELDPLIRMAVGHYQFEAIHPFSDGNGRTGRILNILYLIQGGVLSIPILYLSRYIIRNKSDYYRLLNSVTTNGEWESWVLYMLDAVQQTAKWTTSKIAAIRHSMSTITVQVKEKLPGIYSRELIEIIFSQPYSRIGTLVEADIGTRQTSSQYLKQLVEIGILREISVGREKFFVNLQLMDLLQSQTS